MNNCDKCGKSEGLSFKCKYCGSTFCSKCRLPEDHNCPGLKGFEENKKHWQKVVKSENKRKLYKFSRHSSRKNKYRKNHYLKKRKKNNYEQIEIHLSEIKSISEHRKKSSFKKNTSKVKYWLKKRNHRAYNFNRRKKYLIKNILFLTISIILLFFFYSRTEQLNQVSLWILNFGAILIWVSLIFSLIFLWKLLKEIKNVIKRQRKWVKIILLIILLILLWQIIMNGGAIMIKAKDISQEIEYPLFFPLSFSKYNSLRSVEISSPAFFNENNCSEIEKHVKNQDLAISRYKKNFCAATCGENNFEYKRYYCDKLDKFHCFCKIKENE